MQRRAACCKQCVSESCAVRRQVRSGEVVSQYEIMRFAQLFNDELTLDNLERIHLVNLCRFVGIQPFGTDAFLVSRLRTHLATIKARRARGMLLHIGQELSILTFVPISCPFVSNHKQHTVCGKWTKINRCKVG